MRRYGHWSENRKAIPENTERCIAQVLPPGGYSMTSYQCERKRVHGPEGLYCKQHAKMLEAGSYVSVPPNEPHPKSKEER